MREEAECIPKCSAAKESKTPPLQRKTGGAEEICASCWVKNGLNGGERKLSRLFVFFGFLDCQNLDLLAFSYWSMVSWHGKFSGSLNGLGPLWCAIDRCFLPFARIWLPEF